MAKQPLRPGMNQPSLNLDQVRMILHIYWIDHYTRAAQGKQGTYGIRKKLARQFNTSVEIIKKIVSIKYNTPEKTRRRYPSISLHYIKRKARTTLKREGIIP